MRRRDALAALTTLVPATGCLDAGAGPGTDTASAYRDDCPSFADDADRTVCYRRDRGRAALLLAPEDGPLVLDAGDGEPDAGDGEPDTGDGGTDAGDGGTDAGGGVVDAVSLVLRNGTGRTVQFNPYGWTLHRRAGDGWEHVAPDVVPEPLLRLPPGQAHRWSLSAVPHPSPNDPAATTIDADVSPGVHAFAVDGTLDDGPRVECVARFAVVRRAEG